MTVDQFITFIYTADLEAAHAFYADGLGLELERDQGVCRIYRIGDGAALGVCNHREPSPAGVIITIVTDDVDGWHERVSAVAETDGPPRTSERFGIYHFFATAPDGYRLEVQRFED